MNTEKDISGEAILALVASDKATEDASLTVDIIADFVCPWSYLGWRRLHKATQAVHGVVSRTWYPFQLNPDMPEEGMGFEDYLATRFGGLDVLRPVLDQLTKMGELEGVRFDFDKLKHVPNTFKAHCLVREAASIGASDQLADQLFRAVFELGEDIGSEPVLLRIALQTGLTAEQFDTAMDLDGATGKIVASEEKTVRLAGVSGVPNFLLNKRVFVVGAQDTAQILSAIDRAIFGDPDAQVNAPKH